MFDFQFKQHLLLTDDAKLVFLSRKKNEMFQITLNTFCLVQDNVFSNDERSMQGRKFNYPAEDQFNWMLKKKDICRACKNSNLDEDLTITLKFHTKQQPSQLPFLLNPPSFIHEKPTTKDQ